MHTCVSIEIFFNFNTKFYFISLFHTCFFTFSNTTKVIIEDLSPFMLYQFKVRVLSNNTEDNSFRETIECYTKEDGI